MQPTLPFAHLNLRYNPFGELPDDERAALAVADLAPLRAHLDQRRAAVQLLGPPGHGKTTHLLALQRALPDAAYVRAWSDRPLRLPKAAVWLIDEVDQCGLLRRIRLWGQARPVAVATHRDLGHELRAFGRPVLTVRPAAREVLATLVARRIVAARRREGPTPVVGSATLQGLITRHGADVRAVFGELYERFQALENVDVEV